MKSGEPYDLGDGRTVTFTEGRWAPVTGQEAPGTVGIEVFFVIESGDRTEAGSTTVYVHVDDWPNPDDNGSTPTGGQS